MEGCPLIQMMYSQKAPCVMGVYSSLGKHI